MSYCYLCSKSKTTMKKWYFECFIADYFPALNKKDPVVSEIQSMITLKGNSNDNDKLLKQTTIQKTKKK